MEPKTESVESDVAAFGDEKRYPTPLDADVNEASSEFFSEAQDASLYAKFIWLTAARLVLVTCLLAVAFKFIFQANPEALGSAERFLFTVALACYIASLVYLIVLRQRRHVSRPFAIFQIALDAILANCAVCLTGGTESIFVFLLPLSVVSAANLLGRRGAWITAAFSSGLFLCFTLGLAFDWLPRPLLSPGKFDLNRAFGLLTLDIGAICLTGILSGILSDQVRRTREALKSSEAAYLKLEKLHECIVNSVSGGLLSLDEEYRIFSSNPAAERIFGLSSKELLGRDARTLLPQLATAKDGHLSGAETQITSPSGKPRWLAASLSPLVFPDSPKNAGFVVSFNDLTERHVLAEAVQRSERLAAVGKLSAGLAHELRNPLASMSGSVELLAESPALSSEDKRLAAIILRETGRLNDLVTDFLRFARPRPLSKAPFDLAKLLQSSVSLWKNDPRFHGVEISLNIPESLIIDGDQDQLDQVIWNLVANARDAVVQAGSRVEISLVNLPNGREVCLTVADDGCGISSEDKAALFDPFFTTKKGGTGLGLAIANGIVTGHGGRIEFGDSPLGKGASFEVILPLASSEFVQSPTDASTGENTSENLEKSGPEKMSNSALD